MLTVLTIAGALIFSLVAFTSLRRASLLFIFLLPFTPRYLALPIGSGDFALSLRRIILVIVVIKIMWMLFMGSKSAWRTIKAAKKVSVFLALIAVLYVIKFVATLHGAFPSGIPYLLNDFLYATVFVFLGLYLLENGTTLYEILKVVALSLVIALFLATFGKILGHPLLNGIAQVEVAIRAHTKNPLAGAYRNGEYRVMGGFDNPLLLAEFISIVIWPCLAMLAADVRKKTWLLLVFFSLLVLYFTGARSGMVVPASVMIMAITMYMTYKMEDQSRIALWLFLFITVPLAAYFVTVELLIPAFQALNPATSATSRSAYARINQYLEVWRLFQQRPYLGWGMRPVYGRSIQDLGTLDNYYLVLVLQGGLGALAITIVTQAYVLWKMFRAYLKTHGFIYFLALGMALLAAALYELFVAEPTNHVYFYLLATCGLWLWYEKRGALKLVRNNPEVHAEWNCGEN